MLSMSIYDILILLNIYPVSLDDLQGFNIFNFFGCNKSKRCEIDTERM